MEDSDEEDDEDEDDDEDDEVFSSQNKPVLFQTGICIFLLPNAL